MALHPEVSSAKWASPIVAHTGVPLLNCEDNMADKQGTSVTAPLCWQLWQPRFCPKESQIKWDHGGVSVLKVNPSFFAFSRAARQTCAAAPRLALFVDTYAAPVLARRRPDQVGS